MKKYIYMMVSFLVAFLLINTAEAANDYTCPTNYTLVGTACIQATQPSTRGGSSWCDSGTLKGGSCVLQTAATPASTGIDDPSNNSNYSCDSGYELIGLTCIKFHGIVSERQGATWCAASGTTKAGNACVISKAATKKESTTQTPNNNNNNNNSSNSGNYATEDDFIGNLSCGNTSFEFHKSLPNFTNVIFDLLKIVTPIIIIITGMLDMFKAVAAQKEDEIKKGQQKLLRRLLAGCVVFLVFVIVETVIHAFAESDEAQNAMDCVDCFLIDSDTCTVNP